MDSNLFSIVLTLIIGILTLYIALYGLAWGRYEFLENRLHRRVDVILQNCNTEKRINFAPMLAELSYIRYPRRPLLNDYKIIYNYLTKNEDIYEEKYSDDVIRKLIENIIKYNRSWDKAKFCFTCYKEKKVKGIDLHDMDLENVSFQDADLYRANLCNAKLYDVNLEYAQIGEAKIDDAELNRAKLINIKVRHYKFEEKCIINLITNEKICENEINKMINNYIEYKNSENSKNSSTEDSAMEAFRECINILSKAKVKTLLEAQLPEYIRKVLKETCTKENLL